MEDLGFKSAISQAFSNVVRDFRGYEGKNIDPTEAINTKNELLSQIKTESEDIENDKNGKKDYIDYLKNKNNIPKILDLIKNKKLSNNKIKTEIKKLLKNPEDINKFLQSVLDKRFSKKETKETTSTSGASGMSYDSPLFGDMKEEKLKGGKADNKTFTDLLKKYKNKSTEQLKLQFNKGMRVEMEHTDDKKFAKEIVLDHLFEDPNYYTKLKKVETKEATSTASSGSYETPKMWAKSLNKKDWRGRSKTQLPGGKFVQVKKKCKRFPYCNQGDIKALNIFENQTLKNTIKKVSEKYDIHEDIIKDIIMTEMNKSY
jgi:hypothetical protein